jgi:hypothetical protein
MCKLILLFAAASVFATQTSAEPATPPAKVEQNAPVDPARLALAREIARAFWPDGTIKQLMGSMSGMQSGMMKDLFDKSPKDLGVEDAKEGDKTLGQLVREKDPHFEERLAISNRVMSEEIGKVMGEMEPQLRETVAELYARRFSKAELEDIAAFFRTPSGKSYGAQLLPMMSDPEYLKAMTGLMPKVMQAMPGLVDKVKKATAHLPPAPEADEATPIDEELPSA